MSKNVYVGNRYVPIHGGTWDNTKNTQYESLTVVLWEGNSFTSKKAVPQGVDISNAAYWVKSADYNVQLAMYRDDVLNYHAFVLAQIGIIQNDSAIVLRPSGGDDTALINAAITTVSQNTRLKKVVLDGNFKVKTGLTFGLPAIVMKSNCILEFTRGSKVTLTTDNQQGYQIIHCVNIDNFEIINPYVVGDRETTTQVTGEWGHGIVLWGCKHFKLTNVYVEKTFGDGVSIGNSASERITEDFYIDSIKTYKCRRNGTTIASATDGIIDYIQAESIDGTLPKACVDFECEVPNETFKNLRIGTIVSKYCKGGVDFLGTGMNLNAFVTTIDITIDNIELIGNNTQDTGMVRFINFDENKVNGLIDIKRIKINKANRSLYFNGIHNGGIKIHIGLLDLETENITDTATFGNKCGIYLESSKRDSKNIGEIIIDQLKFSGDAPYIATIISQSSGTIEPSNFKIGKYVNKITKPYRIDGLMHDIIIKNDKQEVNLADLSTIYNVGQGWQTYHFYSTKYHNEGATGVLDLSFISFNLKDTPITLENKTNGQSIGGNCTGKTIYPTSLGFINGFKSSALGSKITFMQKSNGDIHVLDIIGTWVTY